MLSKKYWYVRYANPSTVLITFLVGILLVVVNLVAQVTPLRDIVFYVTCLVCGVAFLIAILAMLLIYTERGAYRE